MKKIIVPLLAVVALLLSLTAVFSSPASATTYADGTAYASDNNNVAVEASTTQYSDLNDFQGDFFSPLYDYVTSHDTSIFTGAWTQTFDSRCNIDQSFDYPVRQMVVGVTGSNKVAQATADLQSQGWTVGTGLCDGNANTSSGNPVDLNAIIVPNNDPSVATLQADNAALTSKTYLSGVLEYSDIDYAQHKVIAYVNTITDAIRHSLKLDFNQDVVLEMVNATGTDPQEVQATQSSRSADTSPFYGGNDVTIQSQSDYSIRFCTMGFAWHVNSSNADYMISAAHCAPQASVQSARGAETSSGLLNEASYAGETYDPQNCPSSWPRGDLSIWNPRYDWSGAYTGRSVYGRVWVTPTTYASVGGNTNPYVGQTLTIDGGVTGQQYYKVLNVNTSYHPSNLVGCYPYIYQQIHLQKGDGQCTRPGDSGSPVYYSSSNGKKYLAGILSGGSGGNSSNGYTVSPYSLFNCDAWATRIAQVVNTWPGSPLTS